jgi:nucleotide-binding universal stress UspA family protein
MKKKIAIAVDGSVPCGFAVRYAAGLARTIPELHFVLLNIQPAVSQYLTQEAESKPKARQALRLLMAANEKNSLQLLEKARDQIIQSGIDPARVELRTRPRVDGVAQDILDVCQTAPYDAVVVGRRGLGHLQELLTGSVTSNLLAHSQWTPIWMADGEVPNNQIMLAADGSLNALRALDHLAFMLSGNTEAKLHIVHVKPGWSEIRALEFDKEAMADAEQVIAESNQRRMEGFYAEALNVIRKSGLKASQLHYQTIENRFSVASAILDIAREGHFGTIVLARSGIPKSLFSGNVARKIVQKASNSAVWLVP